MLCMGVRRRGLSGLRQGTGHDVCGSCVGSIAGRPSWPFVVGVVVVGVVVAVVAVVVVVGAVGVVVVVVGSGVV